MTKVMTMVIYDFDGSLRDHPSLSLQFPNQCEILLIIYRQVRGAGGGRRGAGGSENNGRQRGKKKKKAEGKCGRWKEGRKDRGG